MLESLESWMCTDLAEQAKSVTVPALVIASALDAPDAAESKAAALLPNAGFVVVPDAAHYAILERPKPIAAHIRDFAASRL